jgi:hypothetical protein
MPGSSAKKMFTIFNPSNEDVSYEITAPDLQQWLKFSSSKGKIPSKEKVDIIAEARVPANAGKKATQAAINIAFSSENSGNGIGLMPSAQIRATITPQAGQVANALTQLTGDVVYESKAAGITKDTLLFIIVMALLSCICIFQLLRRKNRKKYKTKSKPGPHGRRVLPRGKGRKRDTGKHWKAVPEGEFFHYERR